MACSMTKATHRTTQTRDRAPKRWPTGSINVAWLMLAAIWGPDTNLFAQQVRFPSPAGAFDPYAGYPPSGGAYPGGAYPGGAYPYGPAPYSTPSPAFDPYATGPAGPYSAPYSPPPAMPYAPGATPYSATPSSLFPPRPYGSSPGSAGSPSSWSFNDWLTPAPNGDRFIREIRVQDTWLAPIGGDKKLGVDDLDLSLTFQFPFPLFETRQAPLLLTPGFAFHFWEGPVTQAPDSADLPPRTYDAYLDVAWDPEISPWLSAELDVRVGVYSDFDLVTSHSIRVIGAGDAVITVSPVWKVKLGAAYIDRNKVKLLPIAGIVWTPNEDTHWELVFPHPKLSNRLNTINNTTFWWYVAGEYGGGSWTIRRMGGWGDDVDYNDIRISLGVDWASQMNWKGMFEVGYAFNREIIYRSLAPPSFDPSGTIMLRAGLAY